MYQKKKNEILNLQKMFGMEPRNDSVLTEKYAKGETERDAMSIVTELICVDYIYRETLYDCLLEDYMRILAGFLKNKYKLTWTDTWNIVRFYGPESLKIMCVVSTDKKIPMIQKQ